MGENILLRKDNVGEGDVTAGAAIADNVIVRGDGGSKGIQGSGLIIDDTDTMIFNKVSGERVTFPEVATGEGPTNYSMKCGGGYVPFETNQGGTFSMVMGSIGDTGGTSTNQFIIDVGGPDWFAGTVENKFIIQSYNGIATYGLVAGFGSWTNGEYGFALERLVGSEVVSRTMFFDNRVPRSDTARSIDFRIDGDNVLTIENEITTGPPNYPHTVDFPLQHITAPGGIIVNRYTNIDSTTVFGVLDVTNILAVNPNAGAVMALKPLGTATVTATLVTNAESTANYAVLENSVSGGVAKLATWRLGTGTGISTLCIGEMTSAFFGVGTLDTLTAIEFYFAGAVEMSLQPNTLVFNNGAIDTQIDWATNGELGLQVATNDILRLSATQAISYQDFLIPSDTKKIFLGASQDASIEYDGTDAKIDTSLNNPSDLVIDCGTQKTLVLTEEVWDDEKIVPGAFQFAGNADPTIRDWQPGGTGATLKVYKFRKNDEVFGSVQLTHRYEEGEDIYVHIHWTPCDRGAAESGNAVGWKVDATWTNVNAAFSGTTTYDLSDTCTGTDDQHEITSDVLIDGTGQKISSILMVRIYRSDTGTDDTWSSGTAANSPALIECDFHVPVNTMGSRQEFIK